VFVAQTPENRIRSVNTRQHECSLTADDFAKPG
jgi:hypothetical protein